MLTSLFVVLVSINHSIAQVYPDPAFPHEGESVTIYFDASKGNLGLQGFSGDVYVHTGVITDQSSGLTDWKYVKTEWGENTAATKLTRISSDLYSFTISDIRSYYGVPNSEKILKLAMVFRSADAETEGKGENNTDLFIELYSDGVHVKFNTPSEESTILELNDVVDVEVLGGAIGSSLQTIELFKNGTKVSETTDDTLSYSVTVNSQGITGLTAIATNSNGAKDTSEVSLIVPTDVVNANRPSGITEGIHYYDNDPTKVTLSLLAPFKDLVYVIGDFTDWKVHPNYQMKRHQTSYNEVYWWITITGLQPGKKYRFQYLVDNDIRIADPYSEMVLHADDKYIDEETYPDLMEYPEDKTTDYVSVIETDKEDFDWTDDSWTPPSKDNLVIYELLVRDFSDKHDFATIIDSLDYIQKLGVNAIELMPVNEFEGNNSWGYNPVFYLAPDRYYGPGEDLKRLVNEAHNRGIAVILDAVFNHSFGQSPMVRLYNDGKYGSPTSENIWFNTSARHPFNVGYDFDHSSKFTQRFIDVVNKYWVEEYHIDGYRYDLSKGFTQKYTTDVGAWNQYDQSRIDLLNRMKSELHGTYPDTYMILEHLGNNDEEIVLANSGYMLWGIMHDQYKDAALGFGGDLSNVAHSNRGWTYKHLVGYMESHDEERIMHELTNYGNSFSGYDVKKQTTALNRMKIAHAFLLAVPGPKMIWQFGELGYDISIDENGRTGEKPILWEYNDEADRKRLYQTTAELAKLKTTHPSFQTNDFTLDLGGKQKRILLKAATDVQILGNFDVISSDVWPYGHNSGSGKWWYEYFSGDSLFINENSLSPVNMAPGAFEIYSTSKLGSPPSGLLNEIRPDISLSKTSINFEEVSGSGNEPPFEKTLTIENTGSADLVITDISNFSSEFSVDPINGTIAPGQELVVTVTFNPGSFGSFNDTFTITATGLSKKNFTVSGSYTSGIPGSTTLTSPANNSLNIQLDATLSWSEVSNASSYEIEIVDTETDEAIVSFDDITENSFTPEGLEYSTKYRWRVRALNEFGDGNWSSAFNFTTIPPAPSVVIPASPDSAATEISTSPVLSWHILPEVDTYEYQLASDPNFENLVKNGSGLETNSIQVSGLSANSPYFWRVRGTNISGTGTWSATWKFTTSAIGTPVLAYPSESMANVQLTDSLSWNPAVNADTYTVQVSKTSDFRIKAEQSELSDTTFSPDFLERNTVYFWRVRSVSSEFTSGWSSTGIFTTVFDTPGIPVPSAPAPMSVNIPDSISFSWDIPELAWSFELQIDSSSAFQTAIIDTSGLTGNTFPVNNLLDRNTTYYWRLRSVNPSDTSAWSDTLSFTTLPEIPEVPALISPADSSIDLSTSLNFTWNASGDSTISYQFQLAADASFKQKMDTSGVADTLLSVSGLIHNQTYYWRVKATGPGGISAWSAKRLFKTNIALPGIPQVVQPITNDLLDPVENSFIWTNAARASSYHFQVSTDVDFAELVVDSLNLTSQKTGNIALAGETTYFWRVRGVNKAGGGEWSSIQEFSTSIITGIETEGIPDTYQLEQNYPNPFNPSTNIRYALPEAGEVLLEVFNITGQKVATLVESHKNTGYHTVKFNASRLASGLYLYRIKSGDFVQIKKLMLIK